MIIVPGAGNAPSGKVYVRPTHEILKRFRSRLSSLIRDANLTQRDRNDIDRVIDREVKRVFVDGKATMEERLNYWRNRRMADTTRSFMTGIQQAQDHWDSEYLGPLVRWGMSLIPPEGRSDLVKLHLWDLARGFAATRNRNHYAVSLDFRDYVEKRFVPEVKNSLRAQILQDLAVEKAREESIKQAQHYSQG